MKTYNECFLKQDCPCWALHTSHPNTYAILLTSTLRMSPLSRCFLPPWEVKVTRGRSTRGCTSCRDAQDFYFTTSPEEMEKGVCPVFSDRSGPFPASAWATVLELVFLQVPGAGRWLPRSLWLAVVSVLRCVHQQNSPARAHTYGWPLGPGSEPCLYIGMALGAFKMGKSWDSPLEVCRSCPGDFTAQQRLRTQPRGCHSGRPARWGPSSV